MDRMPDSAHNHDFGAIEAAVKETARGRAFLADYAKKVRQSDTLTLLAMIGRLERWCEQQTARIEEIADGLAEGRSPEQVLDHRRNLPQMTYEVTPPRGPEPSALARPAGARDARSPDSQYQNTADRIEYLATAFSELDRKVAGLTDACRSPRAFGDGQQVTALEGLSMAPASQQPDTSRQILAEDRRQTGACSEGDVLDDIAKALGTVGRWPEK